MLQHFLKEKDIWAIAPMSVIKAIAGDNLVCCRLKESPPPRICYELTGRYLNFAHVETVKMFDEALAEHIRANSSICEFEDWMLEKR